MSSPAKYMRKYPSVGIGLLLLFSITLVAVIYIHPVQASNTIYILADGSIEPQTANITSLDNVTYTFTDNNYDSIVIERDNIILDGRGFTLQALNGHGIDISGRSNVTIKNINIEKCGQEASYANGIYLDYSYNNTIFNVSIINTRGGTAIGLSSSSGNRIHHNFLKNNGIHLYQTIDNTIYNNTFVRSIIELKGNRDRVCYNNFTEGEINIYGEYNEIYGNIVTKNGMEGIYVGGSFNNVTGNIVTECEYGLLLRGHHGNVLRENKMANNTFNFGLLNEGELEIYNDVDVSNTVDGKPIYFWNDVRDATVSSDAGAVILVDCINITVRDLDLRKNLQGILLVSCHNCTILNNTITENANEFGNPRSGGIVIQWSSYIVVHENNITNNNVVGIFIYESWNNTISENIIAKNDIMGVDILDSNYTVFSGNTLSNNLRGIRLGSAFHNNISRNRIIGPGFYGIELAAVHNTIINNDIIYYKDGIDLYSRFNEIIGNTIMESYGAGIYVSSAENNTVYHNNFVDNAEHISFNYLSTKYRNTWDNGYSSGGNYWSGYEDRYPNATELDGSGIWDTPYNITEANIDNYPLVAPTKPITRKFTAYGSLEVEIYSNSSISEFQFDTTDEKLTFNVTGPTGTKGFCNVTVPANLLEGDFSLFIDGVPLIEDTNYTKRYNGTHYAFYITYAYSEHTIEIVGTEVIPEFPSALVFAVFITFMTLIILKKKNSKKQKLNHQPLHFLKS